jgi:hypothetical protein
MGLDLGFYAARSYSPLRPPSTARRWIRCCERSAAGWPGRGGRSWRLRWGRWLLSCRAYRARTMRRWRSPKISIRSVTSVRAMRTNRSAEAFARGLRGRILIASMPALARTTPKDPGELPGPVADQEPEACGAAAEMHPEIADLLGGSRPVRVRGDPEDVDVASRRPGRRSGKSDEETQLIIVPQGRPPQPLRQLTDRADFWHPTRSLGGVGAPWLGMLVTGVAVRVWRRAGAGGRGGGRRGRWRG